VTRRIRIDAEALDELVEAARWYEERERGRGALFSNVAFARVEALGSFPDAGVPVQGVSGALLARQVRLLRYPYLVVYAVADDEIRVVAFAHERQQPGYWTDRLES
jgi:plasmid stabilization system protein ParE